MCVIGTMGVYMEERQREGKRGQSQLLCIRCQQKIDAWNPEGVIYCGLEGLEKTQGSRHALNDALDVTLTLKLSIPNSVSLRDFIGLYNREVPRRM